MRKFKITNNKKLALVMSFFVAITAVPAITNNYKAAEQTVYAGENFNINSRLDMSELCGFAAEYSEGLDTTTGGGNAEPVIVTNYSEFASAVSGTTPRVVVVSGSIISMSSGVKDGGGYAVPIGSNKTIIGMDDNAELFGGIVIKNSSNVIVSNLNIHGTWPYKGPSDAIGVESSHHVWLNHLNVWNSEDGNIDIKTGSDYITVSWCKLWYEDVVCEWDTVEGTTDKQVEYKAGETAYAKNHGHRLACLVGSGAGDHDDTDMGKLHVTVHHNWYSDYVHERMPRVMYGRVHAYNNYYDCKNNLYCIGADSYASVLIENNYFNKVKNPHQFSYPDKALPASITARGNEYVDTSGSKDSGQKFTSVPVKAFETTTYDYKLNTAKDVPDVVTQYAGAKPLTSVPEKYKNASLVKGVEDKEIVRDTSSPLPTLAPANKTNDNPVTYDKTNDIYTYHGQNSDNTNGYLTIENPFKNLDYSETLKLSGGYPSWSKGATISYWVNLPTTAKDAVVLNFNLENDRQMQRDDAYHYNMCQQYDENDKAYSLGTKKTYVDAAGKEYTVLSGYGKNVQYNPNYPSKGYYATTSNGSAIYAYEKGKDSSKKSNWTYLSYIGSGYFKDYAYKFDETYGGKYSKVEEGYISGSFSIYASGTMGYRQDNWKALQINPNLDTYGVLLDAHQFNQFYYWGNGSDWTLSGSSKKTPVMADKGNWHFVVVTIQNDYVTFFMDGVEMTTDYINWWGSSLTSNINSAGKGFNLGYGNKINPRTNNPSLGYSTDMLLLDFISDKDTTLMVGGVGAGANNLGQDTIKTPDGTQIKKLNFYDYVVEKTCIKRDKIDLSAVSSVPTPLPTRKPNTAATPKPTLPPEATTQPSGSTTAPGENTTKPSESTTAPGENTTKPSENTTAPGENTTKPSGSTTAPGGATTAPGTNTTQPGESTTQPGENTTAPPTSEEILYGDVDDNKKVNLLDAKIILKMALGIIREKDETKLERADVNFDGKVDLYDAKIVLLASLGIKSIAKANLVIKLGL